MGAAERKALAGGGLVGRISEEFYIFDGRADSNREAGTLGENEWWVILNSK
jgi:hypothetical protein